MTILARETQAPPASRVPMRGLAIAASLVIAATAAGAILSTHPAAGAFLKSSWPFLNLIVSVAVVVLLIAAVRVHPFLALILAAISAGLISPSGSLPGEAKLGHFAAAVELTTLEFGKLAGNIGIVIALAAIIGTCLLESGAADRVVRRFLAAFGQKRAGLALLLSTYIISIPIFFDTMFLLLAPIARALFARTRRDYLLYLMVICCAAGITHSVVIPHPGPAVMAANLQIDPGLTIIVALAIGLVPMFAGWLAMRWVNRRMPVIPDTAAADPDDLAPMMDEDESRLPSLSASLLPVILPVALIWFASVVAAAGGRWPAFVKGAAQFLGNKNIALLIGAACSLRLMMRRHGMSLADIGARLGKPLETAGTIILITCAGGAFGAMLNSAGIGEAIRLAIAGRHINLVLLAYFISVAIRIAQGSVTVAIMTASAIVAPLIAGPLPCHPVYIFMAIGFGGFFASWMNDSGFWVISKLGGLSEKQTLASWTILTIVVSVTGLLTTLLLSSVLPFRP